MYIIVYIHIYKYIYIRAMYSYLYTYIRLYVCSRFIIILCLFFSYMSFSLCFSILQIILYTISILFIILVLRSIYSIKKHLCILKLHRYATTMYDVYMYVSMSVYSMYVYMYLYTYQSI